jgi:hypothetical protein
MGLTELHDLVFCPGAPLGGFVLQAIEHAGDLRIVGAVDQFFNQLNELKLGGLFCGGWWSLKAWDKKLGMHAALPMHGRNERTILRSAD